MYDDFKNKKIGILNILNAMAYKSLETHIYGIHTNTEQ